MKLLVDLNGKKPPGFIIKLDPNFWGRIVCMRGVESKKMVICE
jgi:hypothetical protein